MMHRANKQQGAALFIALLLLLILTFLGSALLSNASQGLKMVSAMGDRLGAEHEVEGVMNEVLQSNALQIEIGGMSDGESIPSSDFVAGSTGEVTHSADSECARSQAASSTNAFACRYVRARVSQDYGKSNNSTTASAMGIEQPILGGVGN